jgi:DUF1680 family protein
MQTNVHVSTKELVMRISEVIAQLNKLQDEHGDLEVVAGIRQEEYHDGYIHFDTELRCRLTQVPVWSKDGKKEMKKLVVL